MLIIKRPAMVGKKALTIDNMKNGIYLSLSSLNNAFDDKGGLIRNILVKLTGEVLWFEKLLNESGWKVKALPSEAVANTFEIYTI